MYFKYMEKYGFEQMVFFNDEETGLKGITVIHNTKLGPALGGARLWNYSSEEDAIFDCLRLARGMTYKSAAAGLKLGGGKTVLIGDPKTVKSEAYFTKLGEFIERLNGNYITAEDMNTTTLDMSYINKTTKHVTGLEGKSGDPSPITALGAFYAIKASIKQLYDCEDLSKYSFAVQGAGSTGRELIKHLVENNAKEVYYSEINENNISYIQKKYPNVKLISNEELFKLDIDVLVPCAMGGVINSKSIPDLKTKIICGTANNLLLEEETDSKLLKEKEILYAPDFIVNAGGIINVYHEIIGYNIEDVKVDVKKIYDRLLEIYKLSEENNITTHDAAMLYANNILK